MKALETALIQNSAGMSVDENLNGISTLSDGLSECDLIVLPEVFAYRGDNDGYRAIAEPLNGPISTFVANLAKKHGSWVIAGSIIEKADGAIYNTCVVFNRSGDIAISYRKIHLFEAHLEDGRTIRESDAYDHGNQPELVDIDGWRVGLSICYDLRFPELYRHYSENGADLLLAPANFTQRTGKDHWEILARARAVENQCFVVAPNQCGTNQANEVASYGHSIAVEPWGKVLCEAGQEPELIQTVLDPERIVETRRRIPALRHRRM